MFVRWDNLTEPGGGSEHCPATATRSCATLTRPRHSTCASTRFTRARCSIACPLAHRCPSAGRSTPTGLRARLRLLLCPPHTRVPRLRRRPRLRARDSRQGQRARGAAHGLARGSWKGEHIALGTNTDPYQWVEGRYRLMEGIWAALRDAANPCSVLTKSPLLLRDVAPMLQIAEQRPTSAPACQYPRWTSAPGGRPSRNFQPARSPRGGRRAQPRRYPHGPVRR